MDLELDLQFQWGLEGALGSGSVEGGGSGVGLAVGG